MKILTIVGARPQFIKAAVVSRVLSAHPEKQEILVHTGQHYDDNMSDVFFDELDIPRPKYNLGVGSGGHGFQTGEMLKGLEKLLISEKPDWVMVYGDTNSTLAGALAAAKLWIPVAHIEGGLRSFNKKMPEEINRILVDHCSDLILVPTNQGLKNLEQEGICAKKVALVGDVMFDAAIFYSKLADKKSQILHKMNLQEKKYVLATIHRPENTDDNDRLSKICSFFIESSRNLPIVWPIHPRTKKMLQQSSLLENDHANIHFLDPVGYLDMVSLEKHARLIVTDSGGIQKEAFFHQVPCLTLRDQTEWIETVNLKWNHLISPGDHSSTELLQAFEKMLKDFSIKSLEYPQNLYGDGHAGEKIVDLLDSKS